MLAVLPFENLTGEPDQEYLADGMTDELIAQLGRMAPSRLPIHRSGHPTTGDRRGVSSRGTDHERSVAAAVCGAGAVSDACSGPWGRRDDGAGGSRCPVDVRLPFAVHAPW